MSAGCEHFTIGTGVCGDTAVGRYLTGLCCATHKPSAIAGHDDPNPLGSRPPQSPQRVRINYGHATTDPLGRDGDGWHKSKQSLLPVKDKA